MDTTKLQYSSSVDFDESSVHNIFFTSGYVKTTKYLWIILIKGETYTEGFWEQNAEENVWIEKGWNYWSLEKLVW
jgi:hypothetical protein